MQVHDSGLNHVNVDLVDLFAHDHSLYNQLRRYPQEVIPVFDLVVNQVFQEKFDDPEVSLQVNSMPVQPRLAARAAQRI